MRYPEFLQTGGTIGFVAPSFGCAIEPYQSAFANARETFHRMGYRTVCGPNCFAGEGIGISSTPERCAAELMEYYTGDMCDVLLSCGGGELMCEDLPHLDFARIARAQPKWYLGYSDNTNFTFPLTTLCDVASLYGPCAPSFGMEPWHPAIADAMGVLTGQCLMVHGYDRYEVESDKDEDHPLAPYHVTEPRVMAKVPDADAHMEGRLVGGCLDVLAMLVGTPYDGVSAFAEKYRGDGILWFLEACDLNTMGMRRALWQLEQAGWFRHVAGFLIGRPMNGETFLDLDRHEAVAGILGKYGVPILMDLDIGHVPPSMPLVCGSYAVVDATGNELAIDMQLR